MSSQPAADLSPFRATPPGQRWLRRSAGVVSIGLHLLAGAWLVTRPEAAAKVAQWVEVAIVQPPPPPEPPPPPLEPEPPKPEPERPKPKAVDFKDIPKTPPPEAAPTPPPTAPTPRRLVQGLSASSFAQGSGTGLAVAAGNTTAVAASKDTMSLDEASGAYGAKYTEVLTPPKRVYTPDLEVPDEARKAGIEGKISVVIDLDATGKPVRVRVVKGLGYGLDEACQAAWMRSKWKPARNNDVAVPVSGIPEICSVMAIQ